MDKDSFNLSVIRQHYKEGNNRKSNIFPRYVFVVVVVFFLVPSVLPFGSWKPNDWLNKKITHD